MSTHSKETIEVVRAAMALAERDVDLGLVTIDQIQQIPRTRFAAVERKQAVALLKAEGKSNRAIAKELGVSHVTVNRDVDAPSGTNVPLDGANVPPDQDDRAHKGNGGARAGSAAKRKAKLAKLDYEDNVEAEIKKEHLKTAFLHRADIALRSAVYSGPPDQETARAAALAWDTLAQTLEGK
jgi:Helix-turn-helix domain